MPSKLDFNSSKEFRDKILLRTLPVDNGPLSQTSDSYRVNSSSDFPNIDQPPVDANRTEDLTNIAKVNLYKPNEYFIREELNTLPRRANLSLYPYFTSNTHNFIGIMTVDKFDTESELMKFAAWNIKENPEGPFFSRVQQNLEAATVGRVRLIDALNGSTATAINIVTGKEPLIEANNKITVAKTLPGKGIDFLQTVTGVEFPWSEIPGDYLSNPENPIVNRPNARTPLGQLNQDITGALGSLIGIQRRPKLGQKPSDLFIEYMGTGQRQNLYDNLSYSKYAPNYTTTARSQQSSKVFNFVDSLGQNINKFFGADAPDTIAYIGDDRGNDVKYAMSDFNDRPVRSPFYLSLLFDEIQARLFQRERNLSEGGTIGGKLTWISTKSKNKLGDGNTEWSSQQGGFEDTKSTNFSFRNDSILGYTQEILETLPTNGSEMRSHVANVIDQTSRIFKDGDVLLSRGSAVKYVDKFGQESGVEYCRAWTKDRSYLNYSDTQKRTENIRKFDGSVMGGGSKPWNINIGPVSNGNGSFDGSTNMFKKGDGFYAKKYMFSIENLAWKTSNIPGFTYSDLPYCERGPNGGRVMWFPPYDLKVSEQNNAKWDTNAFLGRPEPIYTYQNTERNGTISFKVVVDHPSILNLLVREHFKGMTDEESENYINAFFAGCEEIDFYDLIIRYATITPDDAKLIKEYLDSGKDPVTIDKHKYILKRATQNEPPITPKNEGTINNINVNLKFLNDKPEKSSVNSYRSPSSYDTYYGEITLPGFADRQIENLNTKLDFLINSFIPTSTYGIKERDADLSIMFGKSNIDPAQLPNLMIEQADLLDGFITDLSSEYTDFVAGVEKMKEDIKNDVVSEITINLVSSTSAIADNDYNFYLSLRRSHSVLKDILNKVSNGAPPSDNFEYTGDNKIEKTYTFRDLGYTDKEGVLKIITVSEGEDFTLQENQKCGTFNFIDTELKTLAPVAFECRQTQVTAVYSKLNQTQVNKPSAITDPSKNTIDVVDDGTYGLDPNRRKSRPPVDAMKYIIMKTLSECYYFKKLEETDPVVFGSLKEKFKYFHPSFHSTTPEGLNARLTFLLQCIRPGDTIPIKGVNSALDFRARNTSFGPPPICILRVGDFYHSKIVIKDVNIGYEESPWDLNPEGIGIQPMIANVTLQIAFIGGQGLEKPVNWLQNALSSNFFANTEMYDPRSIGTNQSIGGVNQEQFTKEFLEKILDDSNRKPTYVEPDTSKKISTGQYIGVQNGNTIDYTSLIQPIFDATDNYINKFPEKYNSIVTTYGKNVSSILLSPTYRTNNKYNVYKVTSGSATPIDLFGLYGKGRDLFVLTSMLQEKLYKTLETIDILNMFGFNKVIPTNKIPVATKYLKEYLVKFIQTKIDQMNSNENLKAIESLRNDFIRTFDGVNFVVRYGYDGKLNEEDKGATKVENSGFTYDLLYTGYSSCVDYIVKNSTQFYNDLDTSINYGSPIINLTDNQFSSIMSSLLYPVDSKTFISETFGRDTLIFDSALTQKISEKYNKFVTETKEKNFKISKFVGRTNNSEIKFQINTESPITDNGIIDELTKLNKEQNVVINELNYYRP